MANTRFLIKVGDVYYLTRGKLLTYDPSAAKDDRQKKDMEFVRETFKKIHDSPHTWYPAVQITDSSFSPYNTGEVS
jgi:hypothetical protein